MDFGVAQGFGKDEQTAVAQRGSSGIAVNNDMVAENEIRRECDACEKVSVHGEESVDELEGAKGDAGEKVAL